MLKLKKLKFLTIALAGTMIFALGGCSSAGKTSTETADNSPSVFQEMKTTDIDGNNVDSSIFKENKLTVLNVWNEGCTPCIDEIPILDQLNKEYAGKGVSIKGVIYELKAGLSDSSKKAVKDILSDANADYQQLTVSEEMAESDQFMNMAAFPTTYFVDSTGKIVDTIEGSNDYEGWKEVIDNILKKVESNE